MENIVACDSTMVKDTVIVLWTLNLHRSIAYLWHIFPPDTYEIEKNVEVISGLQDFANEAVDTFLLQSETGWQPADFLPDMSKPLALDEVKELQVRAEGLPAEVITSLVGNMIAEEALPTYQTCFNLIKGVNEEGNVASENGWVKWAKRWTAEENRHEKAYKTFMEKIFEIGPNGALLAFEKMMKRQVTMPAVLMDDSSSHSLFAHLLALTQKLGIYTVFDYAAITKHLTQLWKLETLTGLSDYAVRAQVYLGNLAERYRKVAGRMKEPETVKLAWLVSWL